MKLFRLNYNFVDIYVLYFTCEDLTQIHCFGGACFYKFIEFKSFIYINDEKEER